jgi:hypothetical protein
VGADVLGDVERRSLVVLGVPLTADEGGLPALLGAVVAPLPAQGEQRAVRGHGTDAVDPRQRGEASGRDLGVQTVDDREALLHHATEAPHLGRGRVRGALDENRYEFVLGGGSGSR